MRSVAGRAASGISEAAAGGVRGAFSATGGTLPAAGSVAGNAASAGGASSAPEWARKLRGHQRMREGATVTAHSLVTSINSDLLGCVIAQVTANVYDTVTGRYLLIPQGFRLIGAYDSVIAFGQERALVVRQRIVMPDGSSVVIDPSRHRCRRLCRARR